MSSTPVVGELYFYPIKSFRGLRTHELILEKEGPCLDRQWMLVDSENRFLTQRQHPELARIGLSLFDEASIELSNQQFGEIDFGLEEHEGTEFNVLVWKATVPAFEVSTEVSNWLSEYLKKKVRLVRLSPNAQRVFNPELPERHVRFVDDKPLLVISKASLEDLEKRANLTLSMSRFRPNIVVEHAPAHSEDSWGSFGINGIEFKAMKPCTRCKITTTHPLTGEVGEEPLKTLATYRRLEKGIAFGYYYAHLKEGRVRVGDSVTVPFLG